MKKIVFSRESVRPLAEPYGDRFTLAFPVSEAETLKHLADAHAFVSVMGSPVTEKFLSHAGRDLRVVGANTAGYDHIDVAACTRAKYVVVNAPNELVYPTAELAVGLTIAVMRRIVYEDKTLRKDLSTTRPFLPDGPESLYGKTAGIVGLGRIGKTVAGMLRSFGAKIVYTDLGRVELDASLEARYLPFEELLAQADVISLHCPYLPETHHLMNREAFARMKPTAFFINAARGKVMDEAALIEALKAGKIAGAGLDVYETEPVIAPELTAFDNVVLSPHVGSGTRDTRVRMFQECMDGIIAVLDGQIPRNVVNRELFKQEDHDSR